MQFVLYGATGDLSIQKIIPAIFSLWRRKELGNISSILLVSRRKWDMEKMTLYIKEKNQSLAQNTHFDLFINEMCRYIEADLSSEPSFRALALRISSPALIFLSISPALYEDFINKLSYSEFKNVLSDPRTRLIIEKPFGTSLESSALLDKICTNVLEEKQIFRVDHYLAKSQIMSLMEWSTGDYARNFFKQGTPSKITLRMFEKKDVQGRGAFYDHVGAIKDVGQNHALMALSSVGIAGVSGDTNTSRKIFIESLSPYKINEWLFGQYEGYRQHEGVKYNSDTETFFDVSFHSSLPLFRNTIFRIEAGKALYDSYVNVNIEWNSSEYISIGIQPKKFIEISDGLFMRLDKEQIEAIKKIDSKDESDAYETLIKKASLGDDDYFVSMPEVSASWRIADNVERIKKENISKLYIYHKGWKPFETY